MRVTDSMISELARTSVADARDRALTAQRVASSGTRVEKPSDDPAAAALGRRKVAEMARADAMVKSANAGKLSLDSVEDGLSNVDDVLARASEIAIQAGNATTSASDRAMLGNEMAGLRDQILAIANTQVDGKYVMGGLRQGTAPFDATGAFVGDRTAPTIEVAPGVRTPTSITAGEVLAPVGGLDVPAALARLSSALGSNDLVAIRSGIDDLSAATQQVSTARGSLGVAQNALMMAASLGAAVKNRANEVRSGAVEADTYDAISALTTAQSALQQAVAIAAKLPLPGLAQKT